jgi:hypothetical protein
VEATPIEVEEDTPPPSRTAPPTLKADAEADAKAKAKAEAEAKAEARRRRAAAKLGMGERGFIPIHLERRKSILHPISFC